MSNSAQFVLESYSSILNAISKEGIHYSDGPSHGDISFQISTKIGSPELPLPYFSDKLYESLCVKVSEILRNEPTLIQLQSPIVIIGDLHGSLLDFLRIITYFEFNSSNCFLFLGDFVDRGQFSLEILTILYSLKILYPKRFYLIRGNHEFENICSTYGFKEEIRMKTFDNLFNKNSNSSNTQDSNLSEPNDSVFSSFLSSFSWLPLAAVIDDEIFCVHGGISPYLTSLGKLSKIERPITNYTTLPLIEDMMWADVSKNNKHDSYIANTRGTGTVFSETQLDHFFKITGISSVVRGHQFIDCGVEYLFNSKLVTVFSASSYRIQKGKPKNKCGALVIGNLPTRPMRRESFDSSSYDSDQFDSVIDSPSIISCDSNSAYDNSDTCLAPEPRYSYMSSRHNLNLSIPPKPLSHEAPVPRPFSSRIPNIAKPNEKYVIDNSDNDDYGNCSGIRVKSILESCGCKKNGSSQHGGHVSVTRSNSLASSQRSQMCETIQKLQSLYRSNNSLSSHGSVGNISALDNFLNNEPNIKNTQFNRTCPLSLSNTDKFIARKKAKSVYISPSNQNQCLTPRRTNSVSSSYSMPMEIPTLSNDAADLDMQEFVFDSVDPLKFEEVNYVEKSRPNAPLCMKIMSNEQKRYGYARRRAVKSVEFVTGRVQKNVRREENSVLTEK